MWIDHIAPSRAEGQLKLLYGRVSGPDGEVDNILLAHSLRPHTLEGHLALYKAVLHHRSNSLPKFFLETLGVYVSLLNRCSYCVDHHSMGLRRLIGNEDSATSILEALRSGTFSIFAPGEQAALAYARTLTEAPHSHQDLLAQIEAMRAAGFDDGQILEVNQLVAYFSYANRTVLGLGVTTTGDLLGLSPANADDSDDWSHR